VLARLSVFRGAFTLDAVEAVCGDAAPDVLYVVGRLVEQSLVDVREDAGETRYRLLETVRQYSLARLAETPGAERAARARHARWVAAWTAEIGPRTWSAARGRLVTRLERGADDIRAALEWAAGRGGDPMTGVRIAGALAWFWYSGVPWAEARALTDAALAAADAEGVPDEARPPADQAALAALGYPIARLAYFGGDADAMLRVAARALALWDRVDAAHDASLRAPAVRGRAVMHHIVGFAHAMRGDGDAALAALDRAVDDARAGDERWLHAMLTMRRGLAGAMVGRPERALADYAASLPLLRAVGDAWFRAVALEGMAAVELAQGALEAAAAHARESVAVLADEPDPWFVSRALDILAAIALAPAVGDAGRARMAARLLGAATALRARCGAEVIGPDRARHAATVAAARAALGADFAAEWAAGGALDLAGAFALAAAADVAPPSPEARLARTAALPGGLEPDTFERGSTGPSPAADASAAHGTVPAPADRAPAVEQIEVRVCGPLAVVRGGTPVPPTELTPAKVRELLLYLTVHPPRTKEQIALALWPDASPVQVRNSFHVTMHQLRRALGRKAAVTFAGGTYALTREAPVPDDGTTAAGPADAEAAVVRCDVDAVLAAADAVRAADRAADRSRARGADAVAAAGADAATLAAWQAALALAERGPLGEGEDVGEWLAAPLARVSAAWTEALEALARLHVRAGTPAAAVSVLESLVAAAPLREGAHRMLMAAYVTVGEPARALAHYDALAALLAREVGAVPGRETRALADGIRGQAGRPA
jgi:DNA-binding SARP family transcriptional activator